MTEVRAVPARKLAYGKRLNDYLDNYTKALTINVTNVGSKKIASTRKELRPKDIHIIMGKNTIIRRVLTKRAEDLFAKDPESVKAKNALAMLDMVEGNCGFVFMGAKANIAEIRDNLVSDKVQTAAKFGVIAPVDVIVPAGPTGQDPSQTSFFQALDIPTKINRGQVEIVSDVHLIRKGEKVGRSPAELLVKLGIKPFYYGINVESVYDNGEVYPAAVLDLTDADIAASFARATREVAALCLALNYPTAASVPHSILDAYKNILAVGLAMKDYSWDNLVKVREILADPSKFAAAAAPATGGAAAAVVAEPEEEEEEESSAAAGGDRKSVV